MAKNSVGLGNLGEKATETAKLPSGLKAGLGDIEEKESKEESEDKKEKLPQAQQKMKKGGKVGYKAGGSVSKRADGCAVRGKTRGKIV